MRIYIGGNTIDEHLERDVLKLCSNRLHSYFYIRPGEMDHKNFEKTKHILREGVQNENKRKKSS